MPAYAILGAQWGDEGKGKIVDFLSRDANIVARFSGGNNAGHTVLNEEGKFSLHLVPSGIFWPRSKSVIGNGTVVDPDVLLDEIFALKDRGIDIADRLLVSERAHIVMPYHIVLDSLIEKSKGAKALGTTGKGIGPTYSDKAARTGIRAADILDTDSLRPRLETVLEYVNAVITKVYDGSAISLDTVLDKCEYWKQALGPFIGPVEKTVQQALDSGEHVLLEGAQGALLDLDHGTYPYVTSSNPTIGGACTGLGIHPRHITEIMGVFKAYCTRVGTGPFPTELSDNTGETIRELAQEFGTTTGRPRRVGWFDAVAAQFSSRINGYTSVILTRLDVLDGFSKVRICTGYELDGRIIQDFPGGIAELGRCKPIYEEHDGWDRPTASLTNLSDLPKEARSYVDRLQELVGCPINLISTGPHRHETIEVTPMIQK